jgi:hypothetical protein
MGIGGRGQGAGEAGGAGGQGKKNYIDQCPMPYAQSLAIAGVQR